MKPTLDLPWRPTQWRGIQAKPALSLYQRGLYYAVVQNPGLTNSQYASRLCADRGSVAKWMTALVRAGCVRRDRFRYHPAELTG